MAVFRFFYNLGRPTFNARINGFVDPEGYLLSVHRYSPQMIRFCLTLGREHGELIFADSGFFRKISLITKKFHPDANQLQKRIISLEKNFGYNIKPKEVPNNLRQDYRRLAQNIKSEVYKTEKNINPKETLNQEQIIEPERFICREDILLAILVGLSIEPEYIREKSRFYLYRNKRSVRFYNKTKNGSYGPFNGKPYCVASAVDYNSGFYAGREIARGNVNHLAIGAGAYMADPNYVDYFIKRRKINELGRKFPRRYIRTPLVVRGLMDGYELHTRKALDGFHMLGLGSQIMILIVSLITSKVKDVSFDATSPIKDAVVGLIYFNDPAEKKVRARKLARFFCRNPNKKWKCKCKYCKHYIQKYPFDMLKAERWYKNKGKPDKILAKHLSGDTPLAKSLPMFSEPRGGQRRKDITDWRIGHNHLILENLFKKLNRNNEPDKLLQLVKDEVGRYGNHTSQTYANAAKIAFSIAIKEI